MPQLTWRAVLMGSALGGVLSLTNLYIGLKAGWGFGVAITACILSYAIWSALLRIGVARSPMTILENNCMQSTASSAGYSTGGTLISAFAAYMLINRTTMSLPDMLAWVFFLAVLGVTMAIPMKRQMINVEQLRFPSGIAAAETLAALHATGGRGARAARALGWAGLAALLVKFWAEGLVLVSGKLAPFMIGTWVTAFNQRVLRRGVDGTDGAAVLGAHVHRRRRHHRPARVLEHAARQHHRLDDLRARAHASRGHRGRRATARSCSGRSGPGWRAWSPRACSSFALQWRTAVRAFGDLGAMFGGGRRRADDPIAAIEPPASWFVAGQLVGLVGLAWLGHRTFGMPYWQTAVAVLLSFALALVACRVTGETDTTPVGAMGKITQLVFGVLHPRNVSVNLMSANVTAAAASSSADLLTDLKSGYLLGANPRKQFIAQFAGIFVGTLVTVLSFRLLVPDAGALGTDQFPAPAAQTWRAVAVALSDGIGALGPVKTWSIVDRRACRHHADAPAQGDAGATHSSSRRPPASAWRGPSTGTTACCSSSGARSAWWVERRYPRWSEEFTFPVASGWIAGESLMGVTIVIWENAPELLRRLGGGP